MLNHDAVLFANEAFYQAFANSDVAAMDEVWSRESPVTCVHPGWQALHSRELIMSVWRRIFRDEPGTLIACRAPEAFVVGDMAFVICYEQLADAVMVATNIYRLEQRRWRLVHHQSSPSRSHPADIAALEQTSQLAH